jgi:hypothetical protein
MTRAYLANIGAVPKHRLEDDGPTDRGPQPW